MLMDGRLYAQHKYAFPSPLLAVVELPLLCQDPRTVQGTPKGHLGDTCRISRGTPGRIPGHRIPGGHWGDTLETPRDKARLTVHLKTCI